MRFAEEAYQPLCSAANRAIDLTAAVMKPRVDSSRVLRERVRLETEAKLKAAVTEYLGVQARSQVAAEREWDVFIAYVSSDRPVAEELYNELSVSLRVFVDHRCLKPGDEWGLQLRQAQRNAEHP